jgi:hypothetical protein
MERAGARIVFCHQLHKHLIENLVELNEAPRKHVAAGAVTEYTAVLRSDITGPKSYVYAFIYQSFIFDVYITL